MRAVSIELLLGLGLAFVFNVRLRGIATLRKLTLMPSLVMPLVVGLLNEMPDLVNFLMQTFRTDSEHSHS